MNTENDFQALGLVSRPPYGFKHHSIRESYSLTICWIEFRNGVISGLLPGRRILEKAIKLNLKRNCSKQHQMRLTFSDKLIREYKAVDNLSLKISEDCLADTPRERTVGSCIKLSTT